MRTLSLSLISITGAIALLLTAIALPTLVSRPLSHWALTVGAFSSASAISFIYMIAAIITPTNNKKSHAVVLATYFLALIIGTITGGFWGVVGHMMETEKTDFATALGYINPIIYGGYFLTGLILIFTLSHIIKKRRSSAELATGI